MHIAIGVFKQDSKIVGLRVMDADTCTFKDFQMPNVISGLNIHPNYFDNIDLKNGEVRGTKGSLENYGVVGDMYNIRYVVLAKVLTNDIHTGYIVTDSNGVCKTLEVRDVLYLGQKGVISNGKFVDGAKAIVPFIGDYPVHNVEKQLNIREVRQLGNEDRKAHFIKALKNRLQPNGRIDKWRSDRYFRNSGIDKIFTDDYLTELSKTIDTGDIIVIDNLTENHDIRLERDYLEGIAPKIIIIKKGKGFLKQDISVNTLIIGSNVSLTCNSKEKKVCKLEVENLYLLNDIDNKGIVTITNHYITSKQIVGYGVAFIKKCKIQVDNLRLSGVKFSDTELDVSYFLAETVDSIPYGLFSKSKHMKSFKVKEFVNEETPIEPHAFPDYFKPDLRCIDLSKVTRYDWLSNTIVGERLYIPDRALPFNKDELAGVEGLKYLSIPRNLKDSLLRSGLPSNVEVEIRRL